MKITIKVKKEIEVVAVRAKMGVRYWEDSSFNGEKDDEDGTNCPLKNGEIWEIEIGLETGVIKNWPKGTTAEIHYKVCDAGEYCLVDSDGNEFAEIDGYVPNKLIPGEYGDYVIMTIKENGTIVEWPSEIDLSEFENEDDN